MTVATQAVQNIFATWMGYIAVDIKPKRMTYKCKSCKHFWARDYRTCYKQMGYWLRGGQFGYSKYYEPVSDLIRFDANGKEIYQHNDYVCPNCSKTYGITATAIKAKHSDHKCDAKCLGAKGPNCECSCGGKNHGAGFLI